MEGNGERYILSIDLGTTALKVAVASTRGEIAAAETEPQYVRILPDGGAEQDPDEWWTSIVRATRRLFDTGPVPAHDVIGVNVSSQWSGTVAVDEAGRPQMNAVIWMDSRGAPQVGRVTSGFPSIQGYGARKLLTWIRRTGGVPTHSGKDSIAHILWIKDRRPEVYRATATFLEPKDYLNLCLSGRKVASHDSITLHWVADTRDVTAVRYDDRLLSMGGLDRAKLPDLVPAASVLGPITDEAARQLGLRPDVQVVSGSPDVLAAAVGSGAVRDFQAHLCIGTSSWLTCHVPYKKSDLFHNMASLPSALPGRYLLANEQESAGLCLAYLKDKVLFADDALGGSRPPGDVYRRMDRLAESAPPGAGGLIFLPWLNGERAPVDDSLVRGGFVNQSLGTTRAHLVRAVLEGVAFNSRWLMRYVEKFIGRTLGAITMIGGGASSDLWCRIHADVLGRTVRQAAQPVLANARGAALLASVALGFLAVEEIPDLVPISQTFHPDPANRPTYDRLFAEFLNLYKRLRPITARLNAHEQGPATMDPKE